MESSSSPSLPKERVDIQVENDSKGSKESPPFKNYINTFLWRSRWSHLSRYPGDDMCNGVWSASLALPLMNIVFGSLVGDFNQYFIPGAAPSEESFKASINKSSLYIVYLFIGKFVLTYVSMICFRVFSLHASAALRLEYTKALFAQPISRLDEISVGTITNSITALSNTIQQSVSDRLSILFQSLALLVSAYAIAFKYSWALTLVVSSAILFVLVSFALTVPFLVKLQQRVDKADNHHASLAADVFSSIRTVFSLGAERPLTKKFARLVDDAKKEGLKMSPVSGVHLALLFFAMYVSFALAFWYGLKLYREGHIANINTVITVFFSVLLVVTVLGGIASPLMIITKAIGASAAFFSIIDSETVATSGISDQEAYSRADIIFHNVSFAYPTRPSIYALNGFSATLQTGKTTALVGPSGSGKSTVVALLERWYHLDETARPDSTDTRLPGEITVENHHITELDLKWWRSQIGLVQQEPFLFNESIYNNVAFGLIGSKWENESESSKMELVMEACKEAFADEFITRLPLGYSTIVGEGGIALSGGQRQRLAIARSIVKRPPILIFDEATSSIDVGGEKVVQAALDRISKDRTTIMIAHRLSTVRRADKIIVIRDGINIEDGTHEELIHSKGIYHSMVHAQQLEPLTDLGKDESSGYSELPVKEQINSEEGYIHEIEDNEAPPMEQRAKKFGFFRSFGIIAWEQRSHWILYILIGVGAIGAGSGYALQSWLFANLVKVFQYTGQKLVDAANFWALMFFILALAMAAFYFMLGWASNSISMFIVSAYRKDYFSNLVSESVSFFDREENASGSLGARLSTDPRQVQELFGPTGVFPLISVFNVIGCVIISFIFGWKLAAVTFFAAMPFLFLSAFMRIRYEIMFESLNAEVYKDSSKLAAEAIRGFRTVTSLTMEEHIIQRYADLLQQQRKKALRKAWYATLIFSFSDSVELCAMALTFWYGGQLLASREYDTTAFFVVYIAIIQGGQSAGQFFSFGPNIAQAKASTSRILSARATTESILKLPPKEPFFAPDQDCTADIEFRNVTFQYCTRNVPTFLNLNVSIANGQFVAFIGPSGSGKSTVISLLERFYDTTHGSIMLNGRDIRSIELSSYRRYISLVAQEPRLFDGTIHDNLLLGLENTDEQLREEHMVQACKDAEIHDFIMSLPSGYSTELGVNAQASLSGGQKQRLCIARALIRQPLVLLLDEATSSLDSQSERLIQQALERLAMKRNMTIIAVAHRLATIQKADNIFVFGESASNPGTEILERGTHHELLQNKGPYWQMCQAQALEM
ncbi:lipid A export ATP-binding/permease protein msbA [Penicillium brasilianum]|uniref:Lipid A export ATP-binding/permease protein msbA n=1 Tax=Penicillium brasilianum TaxID=104259 RepID=A0A1S9RHV7_PENBI|nr:lipid A export ATP-binding/permease protein msbA [Penicillium brasilianum]